LVKKIAEKIRSNIQSITKYLSTIQEHTSTKWEETVYVMLGQMEAWGVTYNDEEISTIRAYLNRNSKK